NKNYVFIAFPGTNGLEGAGFYVGHPLANLKQADCMINFNLGSGAGLSTGSLQAGGVHTAAQWNAILSKVKEEGLNIRTDTSGIAPSDPFPFYQKNIPVLFLSSGSTGLMSKNDQDAGGDTMVDIVRYVAGIIKELNRAPR